MTEQVKTLAKKPIMVAPSILAWNLGRLGDAVEIASRGKADMVHLDVIDGHFAPNITFGAGTVKALRGLSPLTFDTHLMISEPLRYVEKFIEAGSDILTFHVEVLSPDSFDALYATLRGRGKQMGLALKPGTELPVWAEERLGKLSALIVMTVNPGFSGQTMDMSVMPKLEKISRLVEQKQLAVNIEIDGGVEPENVGEVVTRGGNLLVAGAGVYGKRDPAAAIGDLRAKAVAARGGV
jgi:ribulose-phosphate 3-epimerase